jgi:WD40 repeat protein
MRLLVFLQSGELLEESEAHEKAVTSLALSPDGSHFITASADKTAKVRFS